MDRPKKARKTKCDKCKGTIDVTQKEEPLNEEEQRLLLLMHCQDLEWELLEVVRRNDAAPIAARLSALVAALATFIAAYEGAAGLRFPTDALFEGLRYMLELRRAQLKEKEECSCATIVPDS